MDLLDPKLDVVFKLLFSKEENARLLISLLTAVLAPALPIVSVRVLDTELTTEQVTDRGVRLDVLVELADRRLVDVEMQCDPRGADRKRWLYHWARLFSDRLRRGEQFVTLKPVACIVFLDMTTENARFHAVYHLREVHTGERLTDALELHLIELPRLEQSPNEGERVLLERWARFLRFDGTSALDSLANEDPIMAEAKEALERLSRDPEAQRMAAIRREADLERHLDRTTALEEGREEGRAAQRGALLAILRARGLAPTEAQAAAIAACNDLAALAEWMVRAATASSVEEVLR